jgi:hypothetical protein
MRPIPGTLTHALLLEKAQQIRLSGDVKLIRIDNSTGDAGGGKWIVSHPDGYLLSRRGWRKNTGSADKLALSDEVDVEEFQYFPGRLRFMTALEAADFYFCNCVGRDKEPVFDIEIVKLRDYIAERFVGYDRERAVKAACSILGK